MKRSGAIGCGVLFVLGACSAGSGPVGVPPFGDREPPGTTGTTGHEDPGSRGRDDPGTGGRDVAAGNGETHAPAPGGAPGKMPATNCPKCGKYACTGVLKGMATDTMLDLSAAPMGACKTGPLTLNCGGVLKQSGSPDGTWASAGKTLNLSAQGDTLTCSPL